MTTFRIREPVDVLLDYRDAAELEVFLMEQWIDRHADDPQRVEAVRASMEQVKRIRANLRKIRHAVAHLEGHPETKIVKDDQP